MLPKDFVLHKETASKRAVTNLREKVAAETGWKHGRFQPANKPWMAIQPGTRRSGELERLDWSAQLTEYESVRWTFSPKPPA